MTPTLPYFNGVISPASHNRMGKSIQCGKKVCSPIEQGLLIQESPVQR